MIPCFCYHLSMKTSQEQNWLRHLRGVRYNLSLADPPSIRLNINYSEHGFKQTNTASYNIKGLEPFLTIRVWQARIDQPLLCMEGSNHHRQMAEDQWWDDRWSICVCQPLILSCGSGLTLLYGEGECSASDQVYSAENTSRITNDCLCSSTGPPFYRWQWTVKLPK